MSRVTISEKDVKDAEKVIKNAIKIIKKRKGKKKRIIAAVCIAALCLAVFAFFFLAKTPVLHSGSVTLPAGSDTEQSTHEASPESPLLYGDGYNIDVDTLPPFDGKTAYVKVNGSVPFFTENDLTVEPFENYSPLDSLGRCGPAFANICLELMPTTPRESISEIKPSGWKQEMYDFISNGALYNRSHLIAHQLAGENANERDLITGTDYMNHNGMMAFENMVADYVKETENHVLFRVTPIFKGKELLCRGVLMEAYSVEDKGEGICCCVFCYNVQPGVKIDYATGASTAEENAPGSETQPAETSEAEEICEYVINVRKHKFHKPDCPGVASMSPENKDYFVGKRSELIEKEYDPCGTCCP